MNASMSDIEIVKEKPFCVAYVEQSLEVCRAALHENSSVIEFIKDQSRELCLYAIERNKEELRTLNNEKTYLSYIDMLDYGSPLQYIRHKSPEICLAAVQANGLALKYIKNEQDENICREAVQQNGDALRYVNVQNEELCLIAVRQRPDVLSCVEHQTVNICVEAIKGDSRAFMFANEEMKRNHDVRLEAIKQDPTLIEYMDEPSDDLLMIAGQAYSNGMRF